MGGDGFELIVVEGHKHRVKAGSGRLSTVLAGRLDGAAGRRGGCAPASQPVAGEGLTERRPAGAQLLRGGIDAAQPLGQREGALGLGPVGEEAAGLPAQWSPSIGRLGPAVWVGRLMSGAEVGPSLPRRNARRWLWRNRSVPPPE